MNAVQLEGDIARESLEVAWGLGDAGKERVSRQRCGVGTSRRSTGTVALASSWEIPDVWARLAIHGFNQSASGATWVRERPNLSGLRDSIRSANLVDTYGPTHDSDVSLSAYHAMRHGLSMFQCGVGLVLGAFRSDCECRLAPAPNLASMFVRVCWTVYPHPPPSKREFWRCTLHVRTKIVFQGKPW